MTIPLSKTSKVYNVLLSRFERVVSSDDVKKIAKAFHVNPRAALVTLTRNETLVPVVFRGVYYVRNRNERDLHTIEEDPFRIIARACDIRLGKRWYFGLSTALKLADLWGQQSLTTITIIARMRVQHAKASFAGYAVEFKVLSISSFNSMLVTDGTIRYSEPVRTLLDFAYFGARHARSDEYARSVVAAIPARERKRLVEQARRSLSDYPHLYRIFLDRLLLELKRSDVLTHSS